MTCFWDGVRKGLQITISNNDFIDYLKQNNKLEEQSHILWNNIELTTKQLQENQQHIVDFNINTIQRGYDCSICDPFIILICQLYLVNINHNFNGYLMKYTHNIVNNYKTLEFKSDKRHFSF